jgi:hypothetical protein
LNRSAAKTSFFLGKTLSYHDKATKRLVQTTKCFGETTKWFVRTTKRLKETIKPFGKTFKRFGESTKRQDETKVTFYRANESLVAPNLFSTVHLCLGEAKSSIDDSLAIDR